MRQVSKQISRQVWKQTTTTITSSGDGRSVCRVAISHYQKIQFSKKICKTWKETWRWDPSTEKKQATGTTCERAWMLDITDKHVEQLL